jgi:hypothetical protein
VNAAGDSESSLLLAQGLGNRDESGHFGWSQHFIEHEFWADQARNHASRAQMEEYVLNRLKYNLK